MNPIEALMTEVESRIPGAKGSIDSPPSPTGSRFLYLEYQDREAVVEWAPLGGGFGVSSFDREPIFGEAADEFYYSIEKAAERLKEVLVDRQATQPTADVLLDKLRSKIGMSQVELANALGISQPTLSKIERRRDMLLSTIIKVVKGLGGMLEITARFPTGRVRIALIDPSKPGPVKTPKREGKLRGRKTRQTSTG